MSYILRNLKSLFVLLFITPFLIMVTVNEFSRLFTTDIGYTIYGQTAINSVEFNKSKCSWSCHNDTAYCKSNHVKLLKRDMDKIDKYYFGMIAKLKSTGNYAFANIIFLVIIWPLIMYLLFVYIIRSTLRIKKIRQ